MSPRAACRLERFGFAEVYDYAGGKMDWLSAGLPYEGEAELVSRAMRRDPVVAALRDPVADVADRILADPAGLAVVVAEHGIVQGVIGGAELKNAPVAAVAEDVMRFGITTVRPSEELPSLINRMDKAGIAEIVITRGDGVLAGIVTTGTARSPQSGP
jgi:predicted transcriptional regulator